MRHICGWFRLWVASGLYLRYMTHTATKNQWIMSRNLDVAFLSVAGLVVFVMLNALSDSNPVWFLGAIAAVAVVDMTHIYITGMRVWREYHIRPRWFMAVFVGFFAFIAAAHYLQVPFLLSFVLYYAMFHFMRQNYGIHRWYLRLNQRTDKVLDWLLLGLTFAPFVAMHFRSGFAGAGFVSNDTNELFLLPWPAAYDVMLWVTGAVAVGWIGYELWLWFKKGMRESGRIVFFASNAVLYGAVFLFARDGMVIVFSLLTMHAFQYIALTGEFGMRRYQMTLGAVGKVVAIAAAVALVDVVGRVVLGVDFAGIMKDYSPASSLLLAALLLPSLAHYTIDMWIWRRSWLEQI